MEYKQITYQRVKNLGNYESERLELSVELNESDDVEDAIKSLKHQVEKSLGIIQSEPENPF